MKKTFLYKITFLLISFTFYSCTNFDELEEDPNSAISVPPSMLLSGIIKDMMETDGPWSEAQRDNQFWVISFDYYGDQDYNWDGIDFKYDQLANVIALEKEVENLTTVNKYGALAKFFKAYYFDYMTKRMGDIPMVESLKGKSKEAIKRPAYDAQKDIYIQILNWLEEANSLITTAIAEVETGELEGDPLYNGNLQRWQKAINSFRLRVLISLSEKTNEIDVANRFAAIYNNPNKYPLLENNADNMMRHYGNEQNNFYVYNPGNYGFNRNRNIIGATYLNLLKSNNDPRIYKVADPAAALYDEQNPKDLGAYVGANTGDEQGPMQVASDNGELSYPNEERYYSNYKGEPYIIIGYAEQEFTIAEAANRGWISAEAETHYKNGISASMAFYDITEQDIDAYLMQTPVQYKGGTKGLEQILVQKYIAFFNNSGRESYFNYRRTGIPTFHIGPSNNNNGKIPLRWKYPQSEYQNNESNVKAALERRFNGTDDINAQMWILK